MKSANQEKKDLTVSLVRVQGLENDGNLFSKLMVERFKVQRKPKWNEVFDQSPIVKAQWNSLRLREGAFY